jgi:serine/threonine protein kinase
LREILRFHGKTTPEAALVVLRGSLLGLAAAHRRGVVHRDYKPDNVLVDGDGVSKLTDFGIAARAGDRPIPAGTMLYAAPEQMAGGPASPAGDVYAATATFYECLTGRPPFSADTNEALLYQHLSEPVPLDPVPEPLRPLMAAGMAKDPKGRPTDAATFVTELNTVAAGAYGRRWADRGRSHLGEAALLLAALWPSGAPPTVQGTTAQRIPLHRRIKPRRNGPRRIQGRLSPAGMAIAASVVIAAVTASLSLAATVGSSAPGRPVAAVTAVPLRPSPGGHSPNTGPAAVSSSSLAQPSQPGSAPPLTHTSQPGSAPSLAQPLQPVSPPPRTHTSQPGSPPTRTHTSQPGSPPTHTSQPGNGGNSAPAAPSDLTVFPVDPDAIEVSWQVNSGNQTGFEISNGFTSIDVEARLDSYTWGGLSPGTYMCFKVLAYNSAGDSAWDPDVFPGHVCTTTPGHSAPPLSVPAAPSDLSVYAVDPSAIELGWHVNSTDQTGFEISNGSTSIDVGPDSDGYVWGDLSPGTYMCFKVLAYNSAGDSAWDPDVSPYYVCATTPGNSSSPSPTPTPTPTILAPAAPSDLTVSAVDSSDIELSWQVNSSDQTGFEISNGSTSIDVGPHSDSYTWGGLSPGTYMCFKILAYNSAGDSAWDPGASPYYVCTTTPSSTPSSTPTPETAS